MKKTTYYGNPWIGMFVRTNDEVTLVPVDCIKKLEDSIIENLKTEIVNISIADSNLIGVYTAMNSSGLVLPNVIHDEELDKLKKFGLNIYVSEDRNNANGNNIVVNDKGGLINPRISKKEKKKMEDVFGVELVERTVAGYHTVGSSCMATNTGFLGHYKTSSDEMDEIKGILKVHGSKGTVNTGTGFVSYGAIVNKAGYVVGDTTTAFEMGRIEEAFGLIR